MKSPFVWDAYSDQPAVLRDKAYKRAQRRAHRMDFVNMLLTALWVLPLSALNMVWHQLRRRTKSATKYSCQFGLCVNLDKGAAQFALVEELAVKHLLIRVPLWDIDHINDYADFARGFGNDKQILIALLQDREHIDDTTLLQRDIRTVFAAFDGISSEFQIGNAINRSKWGFFSVDEYLHFYRTVMAVRDAEFPHLRLCGPAVIDFEYHYTARALFNRAPIRYDALTALLYVDRRGAPANTQYGVFDTRRKIDWLAAINRLSRKSSSEIYLTEVNWPLANTAPYAPTSEKECVSESHYAQYMADYLDTCRASGQITRVYWHQLIAPGYGLVDNRHDAVRKMPAFSAFQRMVRENIS